MISFKRVGLGVLVGLVIMLTSTWLYDVHRPGFTPKNLPCSNTQPFMMFEEGNERVVGCRVSNATWVEVWQKRGDRWVRIEKEIIKIEKANPAQQQTGYVI